MGAITTLCLSELTDRTDCTDEGEGEGESEEEEEVEEEEHQLSLPAATVGGNQTTDAGAELQTLRSNFGGLLGSLFRCLDRQVTSCR